MLLSAPKFSVTGFQACAGDESPSRTSPGPARNPEPVPPRCRRPPAGPERRRKWSASGKPDQNFSVAPAVFRPAAEGSACCRDRVVIGLPENKRERAAEDFSRRTRVPGQTVFRSGATISPQTCWPLARDLLGPGGLDHLHHLIGHRDVIQLEGRLVAFLVAPVEETRAWPWPSPGSSAPCGSG